MEIIQHKNKYYLKTNSGYREVLSTTDSSLNEKIEMLGTGSTYIFNLPNISISFINQFIESYNQGNVINKVLIEVEIRMTDIIIGKTIQLIKLNQSNEISILTEQKQSYSREEVIKLLRKSFEAARMKNKAVDKVGYGNGYGSITGQKRKYTHETESWINQNLK
jgi:hypothetical protein